MSVLCAPRGTAPDPPFTRPGPPKSKAPCVWAWEELGGTWASGPLAMASRQPRPGDWGSPQPPHLLALLPIPHVNLYI